MTLATAANTQPDTPEARAYNRTKRWLEIGDVAVSIAFLALLLVTGWSSSLRDAATADSRLQHELGQPGQLIGLSP